MAVLNDFARRMKIRFFLDPIPKDARILEIGSGDGWVGKYLRTNGWSHYVGIDIYPPADVVGDIRNWQALGLRAESFDIIVAFEVAEHVDCFKECHDLLKPGGRMLISTPLPRADWILRWLERIGLNQRRTSPHDHLVYLRDVAWFARKDVKTVGGLSQWAIFIKEENEPGS